MVVNKVLLDKKVGEIIEEKNIKSIKVLNQKKAVELYKEQGTNGIISIETKDLTKNELEKTYLLYNPTFKENTDGKLEIISGTVRNCEKKIVGNVLVTNLNSKRTALTDSLGNYQIEVRTNDVLEFTTEGYANKRELYLNQKHINTAIKMYESSFVGITAAKPVIYLYPTEKTEVELGINFNGQIATTFPSLNDNWKVTAYPTGQIFDKTTKRFYNSLFWDGDILLPENHYNYKEGFVVEKQNLTSFLIEKLELMGLNNTETNDFVQYWLPILEKNQVNFIHFLSQEAYNVISTNSISPKPDTEIRLFMEFYNLKENIILQEQKLKKTIRNGFTLVEWGGADVGKSKINKAF